MNIEKREPGASECRIFTPTTAPTTTNYLNPFTIRDLTNNSCTREKHALFTA